MKKLLSKTAALVSLLTAIVFSGCFSAFADSGSGIAYRTGQSNTLVVVCSVVIVAALLAIVLMLIIKRRKNK